jgi:hypothetical protein
MLILTFAALTASAGPVSISGLGNGQGWNDGSYYTGYVTLGFDGTPYPGLCIDALHEATGDSWDALYIPLTNTAAVTNVMRAYFGVTDPSVFLPKLYADMAGYAMLSGIGSNQTANTDIQHSVWAQFAPGYTDSGILTSYANEHPALDVGQFGLIADSGYATGGRLEQLFLVDPQPASLQHYFVVDPLNTPTPEPASDIMVGASLILICALLRTRRLQPASAPERREQNRSHS